MSRHVSCILLFAALLAAPSALAEDSAGPEDPDAGSEDEVQPQPAPESQPPAESTGECSNGLLGIICHIVGPLPDVGGVCVRPNNEGEGFAVPKVDQTKNPPLGFSYYEVIIETGGGGADCGS